MTVSQHLLFFPITDPSDTEQIVTNFSIGRLKGFVQLDEHDIIICTDNKMNCIWKVDETSGTASVLAGKCNTTGGFANGAGTEAKFNGPTGIVVDERDLAYVIVADFMNKQLRSVNVDTGHVSTFKSLTKYPIALLWMEENILVSAHNHLVLLEWKASSMTFNERVLNQNTLRTLYGSFWDVQFGSINSLQMIADGLILAAEESTATFTLIDLRRQLSLPVCIGEENCKNSTLLTPERPRTAFCALPTRDGLFALFRNKMFNLTGKTKYKILLNE